MKLNKAIGLNGLRGEQIKKFRPCVKLWLMTTKIWRKVKVIALLKPGKESQKFIFHITVV